jgi:hypothetical protein
MKKILVSGSSVAAGTGFPLGVNDPGTWPNQLRTKLDCHLDNISIAGYDITGLFLNTTKFLYENPIEYDLILLEAPPLNRVIVSPSIHGHIDVSGHHTFNDYKVWHTWFEKSLNITKKDVTYLLKIMLRLNSNYEHWNRLVNVITTVQLLNKKQYNIRFINNALPWDQDFFKNNDSSFARELIDHDLLPDSDIQFVLNKLTKNKKLIDLTLWINPFNSLVDSCIDHAPNDGHPGIKSNNVYSDWIIDYITKYELWND